MREVTEILESGERDLVGAINNKLVSFRSEKITKALKRVADESRVSLITVIDGLDENWDGSNTSAELISGLLTQAATDYAAIGAVTFAFIRENMYRRVSNICPRWDRIEAYFANITWTEEQIRELILKRIESQAAPEAERSWDAIFEPTVAGESSLSYVLRKTQFKPREVILFCRYALETARRHRSAVIRASDIIESETRYSDNRLKDLINEYQDSLPELRVLLEVFIGKPQVALLDDALGILHEYVASGRYAEVCPRLSLTYPTPEALLDLLLGIGFLGIKLKGSETFFFKYYGEQGNVFRELTDIHEVSIHPAFEQALGLTKSGAPLQTKEAGETDIVAASVSVATKMSAAYEKISELIGQLNDIQPGLAGFRRYEELIRSAMAFAFQGYLDNPHFQEHSWAETQIRDVVFDNTGETLFFRTIRDRHGAVTVPFECKNKRVLEPADCHQMESRLTNTTGFFGIICYRGECSEPRRPEIEQLRDIHKRDSRKVILLLSDIKFSQLLSKRTKGKLDHFMYSWYTTYLRRYLS